QEIEAIVGLDDLAFLEAHGDMADRAHLAHVMRTERPHRDLRPKPVPSLERLVECEFEIAHEGGKRGHQRAEILWSDLTVWHQPVRADIGGEIGVDRCQILLDPDALPPFLQYVEMAHHTRAFQSGGRAGKK